MQGQVTMPGTLKVCLGIPGQPCTRLSEHPRCPAHTRAYQAGRTAQRASPRQRGYDHEYDANRTDVGLLTPELIRYYNRPEVRALVERCADLDAALA